MSYFLTEEQIMMKDVAANFARNELMPIAAQIDHDEETPAWVMQRCAELGFLGVRIPEEYGGIGADITTACIILEEVAKASPSFAGLLSVQAVLCPDAVLLHGNEEQKRRLLPGSATGERLLAYSQTEPSGCGNLLAHQTRLTPDGNGYRLNGHKLFCTQGHATTYLVMCRTKKDGVDGYGCVIVEGDAPGFQVQKYEDKLGWRGTNTGPIAFDDVAIAPEDILGDMLTAVLDVWPVNQLSFLGHSATSLGALEGMFEQTVAYIKDRELYGEPMYKLSPIKDRLGQIAAKIEACRCLLYSCTRLVDEGASPVPHGSVCKAFICDTAFECINQLLQFWGGGGMMNSTAINRYMRDARVNMIAEGSTEIHHAAIAEGLGFTSAFAKTGN
ncbi:acyl-CoA dehydrogenase family protein [soil metagenome]